MAERYCKNCGKRGVKSRGLCNACYLRWQRYGNCEYRRKEKTREKLIKAMTVQELASFLDAVADDAYESGRGNECNYPVGHQAWVDWLEKGGEF